MHLWISREQIKIKANLIVVAIAVLISAQATILTWAAYIHSATVDEPAHLVAGIGHWQQRRFDLYRVNPPLTRLIAALPIHFVGTEFNFDQSPPKGIGCSEVALAHRFVSDNVERFRSLLFLARVACVPIAAFGGVCAFYIARRLSGSEAGLACLVFWTFSPLVLGHGQLITPDVTAAAVGLFFFAAYLQWLEHPSWKRALITAIAFTMAIGSKSTWLVLLPTAIGIAALRFGMKARSIRLHDRIGLQLLLMCTIVFWCLAGLYGFKGILNPLHEFRFQSRALRMEDPSFPDRFGNVFENGWIGYLPSPLPADYLLGVDIQKADFEKNKTAYLCGHLQQGGWSYYYLYCAAVKMPFGYLLLILAGIGSLIWPRQILWQEMVILAVALTLFFLVSAQTGINKHFRYVLPALPLFFVIASRLWKVVRVQWRKWLWMSLCLGAVESLWTAPHSIAFFSVTVGGPQQGRFHLLNSNVDWGQDNHRLLKWQQQLPASRDTLYAAVVATRDPAELGLAFEIPGEGDTNDDCKFPKPGLYAINANTLMGYPQIIADGKGGVVKSNGAYWTQFQELQPIDQIGYSIFIYRVE